MLQHSLEDVKYFASTIEDLLLRGVCIKADTHTLPNGEEKSRLGSARPCLVLVWFRSVYLIPQFCNFCFLCFMGRIYCCQSNDIMKDVNQGVKTLQKLIANCYVESHKRSIQLQFVFFFSCELTFLQHTSTLKAKF